MKRAAVLLALALAKRCDDAAPPAIAGRIGKSIAVLASGTVVVVNPDQGSISFLDPTTLATTQTVVVGGEPHALVEVASGLVLVATFRGGEIVAVDPTSAAIASRASVCAGPYGLAESPDRSYVAVTCEWDGTVQRVDPTSLASSVIASGLRRPRAIAITSTNVFVAHNGGGIVHHLDATGSDHPTSLVPTTNAARPAFTKMSANLTSSIAFIGNQAYVSHVLENNTGDTTEPVADDYGTVANTSPKINPIVTPLGSSPISYAKYDGGSRVYSGPSAMVAFGRYLLVAHVSTANIAVIDPSSGASVGTYRVGFTPSGIAVDEEHNVAFVDNALDQSVSRIALGQAFDSSAPSFAADATLVRELTSPYSAAAQAARRFFFDATNPHVTPSGVVACASCHPNGTDDGLVWFEHTTNITLRRRRTKHLANAKTATAPFHWDGQFPTMSELAESTMTNLMGGDGLLVDVSTVQAFVDEIVQPPSLPAADPDAVARGSALFTSMGCSACHASPDFTDDQSHAVLNPESLSADDVFTTADTPGLRGIFLSAPYFHDGRSPDLDSVLHSAMGAAASLTDAQRSDVTAFLNSL